MRKLLIVSLLLSFGLAHAADAVKKSEPKKPAATQPAKKAAPAKKANDPKWKENSMAKKQRECKADPSLPQCQKKAPAKK